MSSSGSSGENRQHVESVEDSIPDSGAALPSDRGSSSSQQQVPPANDVRLSSNAQLAAAGAERSETIELGENSAVRQGWRTGQTDVAHASSAPPLPPRSEFRKSSAGVSPESDTKVPALFHMLRIVPDIASFLAATNFDGCRWLGRLRFTSAGFDIFRVATLWFRAEAPEEKLWQGFEEMLTIVGTQVRVLELTKITDTAMINKLLNLCPNIHTLVSKSQFLPPRRFYAPSTVASNNRTVGGANSRAHARFTTKAATATTTTSTTSSLAGSDRPEPNLRVGEGSPSDDSLPGTSSNDNTGTRTTSTSIFERVVRDSNGPLAFAHGIQGARLGRLPDLGRQFQNERRGVGPVVPARRADHIAKFFAELRRRARGEREPCSEAGHRSGPASPAVGGPKQIVAQSDNGAPVSVLVSQSGVPCEVVTPLRNIVLLGYPGRDSGSSGPFFEATVDFFIENFEHFEAIIVGSEVVCRVLMRALQQRELEQSHLAGQNAGGGSITTNGKSTVSPRSHCGSRLESLSLGRLVQMCLDSLLEDYCANMHKKLRTHPKLELILRVNEAFSSEFPKIATSTFRVLSVMASKYMVSSPTIENMLVSVFLKNMRVMGRSMGGSPSKGVPSSALVFDGGSWSGVDSVGANEMLKVCLWTFLKISSRTIGDAFNENSMSKNILRQFVVRGGVTILIQRLRAREVRHAATAAKAAQAWNARDVVLDGGNFASSTPDVSSDAATLSPAFPYRASSKYTGIGRQYRSGSQWSRKPEKSADVLRDLATVQQIFRFGFAILHLVYVQIDKLLRSAHSYAHPLPSSARGSDGGENDGSIAALKQEILQFVQGQIHSAFGYHASSPALSKGQAHVASAERHNKPGPGFQVESHLLRTDPHIRYHAGCIHSDLPNFTDDGDNLSHRCNTWKLNLKVGDIVDAQDSEEFTWWEAEIVSKYGVDDGRVPDDDDNGEDGVKGEHLGHGPAVPASSIASGAGDFPRSASVDEARVSSASSTGSDAASAAKNVNLNPAGNSNMGSRSQRADGDKDTSRLTMTGGGQNTLIKVHFLGWHVKWNQWIDLRKHPQRIQPRNSMVVAWRRYLRAGSPVEACINKEHLGDLPPGMTEISDPSPVIFGPGKWYHATVLEVRLGEQSLKSRSEGGGTEEGNSHPRLCDTLVYVEVTLGTGSSVRLWLDLQGNNIARPGTHRLGHLNRIAWCSCDIVSDESNTASFDDRVRS